MVKNKHIIISTWDEIYRLIDWCKVTRYCSHDFETTGGQFANEVEYPTIIGISFQPGTSYIIPLGHKESVFKNHYIKILKLIGKELISNSDIVKVAWNMKYEKKWFMRYGVYYKGRCFDGMLAKYILNEERPNDLKSMVNQFIDGYNDYEDEVESIARKSGWANVPLKILSKYCALDCDLTLRLMLYFEPRIIKNKFYNLYRNLLMPGSMVLADSEFKGMDIDVKYLDKLIIEYKHKIEDNEKGLKSHPKVKEFEKSRKIKNFKKLINEVNTEINTLKNKPNSERLIKNREEKISKLLAGEATNNKERKLLEPINFGSPAQMADLLYLDKSGFRFNIIKYTKDQYKRDTDRPSTDEETLEKLRGKDKSGFISKLLNHRELNKLYSTYMVGMTKHITPDNKVHGNYNIHGTVTGRLSASNPNFQQIPRGDTPAAATIKKMFIAPKGYVILQIDYSQAELRVMAEAANESSMLNWFNSNKDIHLASSCKKYNVEYDKIKKILDDENHKDFKLWKKRRKQAKTINFGIIYCQTAKKLATSLSEPPTYDDKGNKTFDGIIVTEQEAKNFLNDFNRDFPNIIKFMRNQKQYAYNNGYVKTFFGRKRRLPNIYDSEDGIRMEAERQSVNAPIQGTASDFAFFSSILIKEKISDKYKHWDLSQRYTVHDSLGFYIKKEYVHKAIKLINPICENPETLKWFGFEMKKVKMKVDFEIGLNWGSLHKYDPNFDYTKIK